MTTWPSSGLRGHNGRHAESAAATEAELHPIASRWVLGAGCRRRAPGLRASNESRGCWRRPKNALRMWRRRGRRPSPPPRRWRAATIASRGRFWRGGGECTGWQGRPGGGSVPAVSGLRGRLERNGGQRPWLLVGGRGWRTRCGSWSGGRRRGAVRGGGGDNGGEWHRRSPRCPHALLSHVGVGSAALWVGASRRPWASDAGVAGTQRRPRPPQPRCKRRLAVAPLWTGAMATATATASGDHRWSWACVTGRRELVDDEGRVGVAVAPLFAGAVAAAIESPSRRCRCQRGARGGRMPRRVYGAAILCETRRVSGRECGREISWARGVDSCHGSNTRWCRKWSGAWRWLSASSAAVARAQWKPRPRETRHECSPATTLLWAGTMAAATGLVSGDRRCLCAVRRGGG